MYIVIIFLHKNEIYVITFLLNPYTSGIKTTTACLKQVKELEAKPLLMGAFKPVCQDNGLYAETQCHGMTFILLFNGDLSPINQGV